MKKLQGYRHALGMCVAVVGVNAALLATTGCQQQRYFGFPLSSWIHDLNHEQDYKRRNACEALGKIGAPAAKAVEPMIGRLKDPNEGVQAFCAEGLGRIAAAGVPDVVSRLEALLTDGDPMVRLHAASALVLAQPTHRAAGNVLVQALLGVGNNQVSQLAQAQLITLGAHGARLLLPHMDTPFKAARLQVIRTLGLVRTQERGAIDVPELVPALVHTAEADSDVEIRVAAVKSLPNVAPQALVEPQFQVLLKNKDEEVAMTAAAMLKHLGVRASPTIGEIDGVTAQ